MKTSNTFEKRAITLFSEGDTIDLAQEVAPFLEKGDVLLLYGDLGTGKTFFTRHLCRFLGIKEEVSSPSFVLLNQYQTPNLVISHYDLYRVKTFDEAIDLGIMDFVDKGLTVVEWPEVIGEMVDIPHYRFDFFYGPPRRVEVSRIC